MTDGTALPLVLLVEDDVVQSELIERALVEAGLRVNLHCIRDGQSALECLRRWIAADRSAQPALVMLDIRLPLLNGIDILRALRADGGPIPFPIVMLTSSRLPDDLLEFFDSDAVSYFIKPLGFAELVRLMDTIGGRWFDASSVSAPQSRQADEQP